MKAKHVYLASFALWVVLCTCHFILRTEAILNGPRDSDEYAYAWSFQSAMFLIFRFPLWCVALVLILALESWHFSRQRLKQSTEPNVVGRP
jgi:hypothetical protein